MQHQNLNMKIFLISFIILFSYTCTAQVFNPNLNRDSIFNTLIVKVHESKKKELTEAYNAGDNNMKDFFLMMLHFPVSNKKEMISNFEDKKKEINELILLYKNLVPKNCSVYIEFNPDDQIFQVPANIDLHIYDEHTKINEQGYGLAPHSNDLKIKLDKLGWDASILEKIKNALAIAGCISIENNKDNTTVGFARSGMGMYSYLIFEKKLNSTQIEEYTNSCSYISYKENIVLKYGGGAIGSDCFPD